MKKAIIASALLAVFGAASAFDASGGATNESIVIVGGSTLSGFHGPVGAPGIGFIGADEQPQFVISLSSISLPMLEVSSSEIGRYYLPGYPHAEPGEEPGPTINTAFNWAQVPTGAEEIYFGLATNDANATHAGTAAFYVGDREGYQAPANGTSYAVSGLLASSDSTSGASPVELTGALSLNADNSALSGNLASENNVENLIINANTVDTDQGVFSGGVIYVGELAGYDANGSVNGQFYGSGSSAALAGIVNGGDAGYVASFGGIAQ